MKQGHKGKAATMPPLCPLSTSVSLTLLCPLTLVRRDVEETRKSNLRYRDPSPLGGFFALVSGRRPPGRAGRLLAGQGLHGHQALRLRDLGADSESARHAHQGDGARERILSPAHP